MKGALHVSQALPALLRDPSGLQVWLCKEIKTGKIVALKKLKKAEMVRRGQIDHVKAERDVLAGIHSPFIVRLYYSFQVHLPETDPGVLAQ